MAIIGGIPHFQTYPYVDFDFATTATGKSLESFGNVGTGRIAPVSGGVWQKRGAFVFFLPMLWKHGKEKFLTVHT